MRDISDNAGAEIVEISESAGGWIWPSFLCVKSRCPKLCTKCVADVEAPSQDKIQYPAI